MRKGKQQRTDGGDRFPGFTEVIEIGSGGFSTVYRARELDTGRLVALKVLNVSDVMPHALDAFQRETRALGALSTHPNIVTLYRPITLADGRPLLVLELCTGSVAGHLRVAPLPAQQAVSYAVKIAGALETAHQAGMLHRDVKPQNILLTQLGEPALADFGVARLQAASQATAGVFGFTTLHAPPEILEGQTLSPATDVYELASTVYQLLSGRAAFTTFDGESPASVILRILRDPVPPLLADGVPIVLSDLLVASMSKDPSARPQRAEQFAEALRAIEVAVGWPVTSYAVMGAEGSGRVVSDAPTVVAPGPGAPPPAPPAPPEPAPVVPAVHVVETPPVAPASAFERAVPVDALPKVSAPSYAPPPAAHEDPLEVTGLFAPHAASGRDLEKTYIPGAPNGVPAPALEPATPGQWQPTAHDRAIVTGVVVGTVVVMIIAVIAIAALVK